MLNALDIFNSSKDLRRVKLTLQLFIQATDDEYIDFDYQGSELMSVENAVFGK